MASILHRAQCSDPRKIRIGSADAGNALGKQARLPAVIVYAAVKQLSRDLQSNEFLRCHDLLRDLVS
jgi:hypothetical protein